MKNKVRSWNRKNKLEIDALLEEIKKRQKEILYDFKSPIYAARMKIDFIDYEKTNILDVNDILDFTKRIIEYSKKDLVEETDIEALISLLPSIVRYFESKEKSTLENVIWLTGSVLGVFPLMIYKEKKKDKKEKEDKKGEVDKSIKLTDILISKILPIPCEEIKIISLSRLLDGLLYFTKIKERLEFKGFDFSYMEIGKYTQKEWKEIEETFERRNELPKDSLYRKDFVIQYIDSLVLLNFFIDKANLKYTAELGKEWDKHFNDLCDEFNEPEYKRNFTNTFYKNLERKADFFLFLYPFLFNDETEKARIIELKRIARNYGIPPSLINKAEELSTKYSEQYDLLLPPLSELKELYRRKFPFEQLKLWGNVLM